MKILFIRFSSIGDIVLTTPVIRCVKQQVKDAEVHFLLKKSYAAVLENSPYVDKKHFFEDNTVQIIDLLKKEKFDVIIDLQKNFRSLRIKTALGVKSFSFNKLNLQKYLLVNFKINILPEIHIVDRYMKAVKSLGVVNDGMGLDYFITDQDESVKNSLPSSHGSGYVAWVIGARHKTKQLPIDKMISISRKIKSPIVLLGGKEDIEIGELLSKEDPVKIFNACGKFSLNQSAALVKNSLNVITHDTGLMHIAAAFQKDIISVWGNTVPEFGMYPYFGSGVQSTKYKVQSVAMIKNEVGVRVDNSLILEVKNLSCRPCTKIGFEKCPKGHFKCMMMQDEKIFETL